MMKGGYKLFNCLNGYLERIYESGVYYNSVKCEFLRLSSFSGVQSEGEVEVIGLDVLDLKNKEILVVDIICEIGIATGILLEKLASKEPKSVKIFALLIKEMRTKFEFTVDWIGFQIPNRFVVGYGLDYNENFRDINHIVTLNDTGLDKFKKKKSIFARGGKDGGTKSMILESLSEIDTPTKLKITSLTLTGVAENNEDKEQTEQIEQPKE